QPIVTTNSLFAVTTGGSLFAGENSTAFSAALLTYSQPPSWEVYDYNASLGYGIVTGNWRGVAQSDRSQTIFVGDEGQAAVEMGLFQNYETGTSEDLKAVCFARGVFFAVGTHETILQGAPYTQGKGLQNVSTRSRISAGSGALIGG